MPQKRPNLPEAVAEALREETDLRGLTFDHEEAPGLSPGAMDLKDCSFRGCCLTDCRFDHTGFENVVFERCDLSGSRFFEGGLQRVTFLDCRMMGTVFTDCVLRESKLSGCGARYLYLSGCTLKHSRLMDCQCQGGAMISLKLQKVTLETCDFTGCDFRGTEMGGLDLSSCVIEGCMRSMDKLKNVTVNLQQAVELSRLLGLNIVP